MPDRGLAQDRHQVPGDLRSRPSGQIGGPAQGRQVLRLDRDEGRVLAHLRGQVGDHRPVPELEGAHQSTRGFPFGRCLGELHEGAEIRKIQGPERQIETITGRHPGYPL